MAATINLNFQDLLGTSLGSAIVGFTLESNLGVVVEGTTIKPGTRVTSPLSSGTGTVSLSAGNYIVDVSGRYFAIGVPVSGNVNLSDLVGATSGGQVYTSVLFYADLASFPATGGDATMYVDKSTNTIYRWNGTAYVSLSGMSQLDTLALIIALT